MKTKEKQILIKTAALNTIKHISDKLPALYAQRWQLEDELRQVNSKINEIKERTDALGLNPMSIIGEQYEVLP